MSTPQKMQHYMEKHKISSLFEELMNRILHEQPDDPMLYMIKCLYKKAGIEVPQNIKLGAAARRRNSPEKLNYGNKDRDYEKPWLSNTRKVRRSVETKEESPVKTSAIQPLDQGAYSSHMHSEANLRHPRKNEVSVKNNISVTKHGNTLEDVLKVTPIRLQRHPITPRTAQSVKTFRSGRHKKTEWNSDTKVVTSSFDDLFEDNSKPTENRQQKTKDRDPRTAWASLGLNPDEDEYSSKGYTGPRRINDTEEEDPLAGELTIAKCTVEEEDNSSGSLNIGRVKGPQVDAKKHRENLEKLLLEKNAEDSGFVDDVDSEPDDALELLEDGEELKREGVRNIPKSGFKLSRILHEREKDANIKLNIHLYPRPVTESLDAGESSFRPYAEEDAYEDESRPATGMSGFRSLQGDTDDEFESVSQVTGPRKPVWNVDDSDGETFQLPKASMTLPEPSKSSVRKRDSEKQKLGASAPVRFGMPGESADSYLPPGKTWNPSASEDVPEDVEVPRESLQSTAGGWQLPRFDSENSIADWSVVSDKPQENGKPKVY